MHLFYATKAACMRAVSKQITDLLDVEEEEVYY